MQTHITFIGGGNMASSLIGGLLANQFPANQITVAEPDADKLEQLASQFAINTSTDNRLAVAHADVVVLAVKPQIMQPVCRAIADTVQQKKPLIISIAAGIRSSDIDRWLGNHCALVRCMPNTPALLQAGATGLYANTQCSQAQQAIAEQILSAAGITLWVKDETQLDAVTAVSGSGPAYFFLLMEAMQKAGEQLGLDSDTAKQLSLQTALGAARMATEGNDDPATLRAKVTSKGGTTEAAINSFLDNGFETLVTTALTSA
ncbi:MAG: pyrroline-5-carboxylate reductase, partial [Gammaproteobacteria bacterium]|nr:pyrroline-5-carboxylate reductase [Gammaproteobacteria bacterium]